MTAFHRIVFLTIAVSAPFYSRAADDEYSRESLRGVTALRIVVEPPNWEGLDIGLSMEQLRTAIELKLRLAGIKVVDVKSRTVPYLYLNVLTIGKAPGVIAFTLRLSFGQTVILERNPKIKSIPAETWSAALIATVGSNKATEEVKGDLTAIVDRFINAYHSVNPK